MQAELWAELYGSPPAAWSFLLTELPAALFLLLCLPALARAPSPRASLARLHALLLAAPLALLLLWVLRAGGVLPGGCWFAATGLAIFAGFAPVTALYFDKLASVLRLGGTAAGLIQAADAVGYAGSISGLAALRHREAAAGGHVHLLAFFDEVTACAVPLCALCAGVAWLWFAHAAAHAARAAQPAVQKADDEAEPFCRRPKF